MGVSARTDTQGYTAENLFTIIFLADYWAATGVESAYCLWNDGSGLPGHSKQLTVSNAVQVYDATPTITDVQQLGTLYPGGSAYITVWGTGFGSAGSANNLTFTPSPGSCAQATAGDITYQITYWEPPLTEETRNLDQINALVTASTNACGDYDVQITSGGVTGNSFQANPQDRRIPRRATRAQRPWMLPRHR